MSNYQGLPSMAIESESGRCFLNQQGTFDVCASMFMRDTKRFLEKEWENVVNNCVSEHDGKTYIDREKLMNNCNYNYLKGMARMIDVISQGSFFASGYLSDEINKKYKESVKE